MRRPRQPGQPVQPVVVRTPEDDAKDDWVLDAFGVDPRDYDRTPPPVDPARLPSGPLDPAGYAAVVSRNQYLAGKYDPESLADHALNLVTGAMDDPVRILTDAERIEHRALSAKIAETLDPPPTPDGARLEGMLGSPAGAIASLAVREAGGGQAAQDLALGLGAAAEGVGLAAAGARAGGATAFLGAQTGEDVVPAERGGGTVSPQLPAPEPPGQPMAAADQVKALSGHGDARHGSHTTVAEQEARVLTQRAPDGKRAPAPVATRFDSPEAQLDAVTQALSRMQSLDAAGLAPHAIQVSRKGVSRLPRHDVVVTGFPGGYGSGVKLQRESAGTRLGVVPTGQYPNAMVVLERDPVTNQWNPLTQYPTDLPPNP